MLLGLFDSGTGGLNTVRYLKEDGRSDLVYLIDRERAPYGTKSEKELVEITERNIKRLTDIGAERVLIACCTASTVHSQIDERYRKISVPIIDAVAKAAEYSTRTRRIGVIATQRTVASRAFSRALKGYAVKEYPMGELVTLIDGGLCDEGATESDRRRIEEMIAPALQDGADTLILGCTHFPALIKTITDIAKGYGVTNVIDSARAGADLLIGK